MAHGHAAEKKTCQVGQGHTDAKRPVGHPFAILGKILDRQIGIGHDGIAQGHGYLGQDQHQQGESKIAGRWKPVGQ
jgi:hypothetical protein